MSTISRKLAVLAVAFVLGACARNAPALPPDLGHLPPNQRLLVGDAESAEGRMDCPELQQAATQSRVDIDRFEQAIASNRGRNQAAMYFGGVIFPPAYLAVRTDEDAKKALDELQSKRDRIDRLSKAKRCPAGGN